MENPTMKRVARWATAIAVLACLGSVRAHHSNSMFDMSNFIWLIGTVVRYEPINPHAVISLEVKTEDGQLQTWTVEGPRLGRLDRLGVDADFVKVGDVIEICGFFLKEEVSTRRSPAQFVHGKVLVKPDGQRWAWGPYGRLENCVSRDEWDSIARGTNPLRPN